MPQATCTIDGCDRGATARGWCPAHYQRWRKTGTTDLVLTEIECACRFCGTTWMFQQRGGSVPAVCDDCQPLAARERQDRWAVANRDLRRESNRRYYHEGGGRERFAAYYAANPEYFHEYRLQQYYKDPEARRAASREWAAQNRDRRLDADHRRRARIMGTAEEPIDRLTVFERDGWMCSLCDTAVDSSLRYPDPMSASLDHVIPLVAGGSHTYANVALAHLICNVRKGAAM